MLICTDSTEVMSILLDVQYEFVIANAAFFSAFAMTDNLTFCFDGVWSDSAQ